MVVEVVPDIVELQDILISIARDQLPTAEQALQLRKTAKADGSIVTLIDTRLQEAIRDELAARWPQVPMLGEEMTHAQQETQLKYSDQGLWVLDPLDGTTNFTVGFPLYGLSLGYVKDGQTQLAVIYDPNRQEVFSAEKGGGAFLNGQRLQPVEQTSLSDCVANVDYKRLTAALAERLVGCPPYRSQRNMGSCVLEWCWLAAGRIQLYLHGGQQLWDHAAGLLILQEAGGMATRLEGVPIRSNILFKQSAVAAANPALFEAWYDWVKQHASL